jgi:methionine-S-sulfoxide reductase
LRGAPFFIFVSTDELEHNISMLHLLASLLILVSAAQAKPQKSVATLAGGCFWGMEEFFRKVPGVLETRVGYTGGKKDKPTYEEVSSGSTGHAETVEITFDPSKVSYEDLLVLFFKMHDPTTLNQQGNDVGTQYRSAIFYNDDEQKKVAEKIKAKVDKSKAWKANVTTEIAKAKKFNPAEEYHQKYLMKHPGGYDNHYLRELAFDLR